MKTKLADVIELTSGEAQFLGYEHSDTIRYTLTDKAMIVFTKAAAIQDAQELESESNNAAT